MSETQSTFRSLVDGQTIFYRKISPRKITQRVIIIHPGLGSHGGRFTGFTDDLQDEHTTFYIIDPRGHGLSSGLRIWVEKFSHYQVDLKSLILISKMENPNVPTFLYGHSQGALVAMDLLRRPDNKNLVSATVFSAPAVQPLYTMRELVYKAATKKLAKIFPKFTLKTDPGNTYGTIDRADWKACDLDPLVAKEFTIGGVLKMLEAGTSAPSWCESIDVPSLFIVGESDYRICLRHLLRAYVRIASKKKELIVQAHAKHEPFKDFSFIANKYSSAIKEWLENQKQSAAVRKTSKKPSKRTSSKKLKTG